MSYDAQSNSWLAFLRYAASAIPDKGKVFEIGPGNKPNRSLVRHFCTEHEHTYFWADINQVGERMKGFRRMLGESSINSPGDEFDGVISFCMLFNCRRPWLLVPELARVCVQNGVVIVVTPMYAKRARYPADVGRIWPDGLQSLFVDAGLKVETMVIASLDKRESSRKHMIGGVSPADVVCVGRKPPYGGKAYKRRLARIARAKEACRDRER
ncbi:MAG: hypothetical protein ACYTG0_25150 [Planctomycetota bacterium]|jgi:SAM-dependent methyltransferase